MKKEWERKMGNDVANACNILKNNLENITHDIETRKTKGRVSKALSALKLYSPEYQERFRRALQEFEFQMCLLGKRDTKQGDVEMGNMTERMKKLQITIETLETFSGHESAIAEMNSELEKLSVMFRRLKESLEIIQQAISSFEHKAIANSRLLETLISTESRTIREKIVEKRRNFNSVSI